MLYMFVASIVLIALVLIGYFIYWLKKNSKQEVTKKDLEPFVTREDIKPLITEDDLRDVYEEVEDVKKILIQFVEGTTGVKVNGNHGHEPSAFDAEWEQLLPLKTSQVAVEEKPAEAEEQPKDFPTPEEQLEKPHRGVSRETFLQRMKLGRAKAKQEKEQSQ